jgi:NADH-ubiquinone oxidoreductase chain 6
MNAFLLDLLTLAAIASAVLVITAKNPVLSVLFLIAVFLNVAGYLVLIGIAYLGLVYLIVYVGAIAILFLFVIMMLNLRLVELVETGRQYTQNLPLATLMAGLFSLFLIKAVPTGHVNGSLFNKVNGLLLAQNSDQASLYRAFSANVTESMLNSYTQIESIGHGLYTYAALWLVVAGLIFMLAMVGPIVLCLNKDSN